MIKTAQQYPVHTLLSHEGNLLYKVPPYQREYSWQKAQWEDLFQDLVEADGEHFLGTIITLNQTVDGAASVVLELVDGQQRMTTITLLLAAIYSLLKEHLDELDEDTRTDLTNLGRQLVRRQDGEPRVTPQTQGHNLDDYRTVMSEVGLNIDHQKVPYFPLRRMSKCHQYFRDAVIKLGDSEGLGEVGAAQRMLEAVKRAVIVKIEVANHADAFVLFESLNNRGMPLTPVDLIKNHLLAQAERVGAMDTEHAFSLWSEMLTNLGDTYANHERFLRHYYNAFKSELPEVASVQVATRSNLIRIYETLLSENITARVESLVEASKLYGRITGVVTDESASSDKLDEALGRLTRVQGAPSYVLLIWMLTNQARLELTQAELIEVVDRLTSFFVRRNLTGYPQTYALPKLFMTIIEDLEGTNSAGSVQLVTDHLTANSSSDSAFGQRLGAAIYDENSDITRFVLTTLAEDAMTKETHVDLWAQEKGRFVWTIEHIFPQGENIPDAWQTMLGGAETAKAAQDEHVHRLGNLTITAFNSTLSNKSFIDKRDRADANGRYIGYKNGLSLNADLQAKDAWTADDIEARTADLAKKVMARFPLG